MSTATENGNATAMERTQAQSKAIVVDDGPFADLLDTARFDHLWRVASLFARSALVPQQFRGKVEDCFIASQMAIRLRVDPFMFMQSTYVVHGKPGMEAKLAIALINTSGLFKGGLDYERVGNDPKKPDYKCRAYAPRIDTGEKVYGPWITWDIVKAERWDQKDGSKWLTIPALMFDYRAATWFGRLYCPERLMGMQTMDEIDDVGEQPRPVASRITASSAIAATRQAISAASAAASEQPNETVTSNGEIVETPAAKADPNELTDAERAEIARKEEAEFLNRKGGK